MGRTVLLLLRPVEELIDHVDRRVGGGGAGDGQLHSNVTG